MFCLSPAFLSLPVPSLPALLPGLQRGFACGHRALFTGSHRQRPDEACCLHVPLVARVALAVPPRRSGEEIVPAGARTAAVCREDIPRRRMMSLSLQPQPCEQLKNQQGPV